MLQKKTLQAVHNFDFLALCESSLSVWIPNDKIFINEFSPDSFRADTPYSAHNVGACLYYKENIRLKRRTDLELLGETIVVELSPKR